EAFIRYTINKAFDIRNSKGQCIITLKATEPIYVTFTSDTVRHVHAFLLTVKLIYIQPISRLLGTDFYPYQSV
ncbi:hypothetical protein, partial [Phocaeicola sp.]|uniref:hypothetical protein n=1 Tax=Phocaeicola sp. TaxID=2773926 RepID=UPI003AB8BF47